MKNVKAFPAMTLLALSVAVMPVAHAQSGGMGGMGMKSDKKGTVHKGTGVVTRVDPATSKVTIKHEPVQSMNWPSMTMGFVVKDKALLQKLKKDQKVDFEFVQQGKDYVVTSVK